MVMPSQNVWEIFGYFFPSYVIPYQLSNVSNSIGYYHFLLIFTRFWMPMFHHLVAKIAAFPRPRLWVLLEQIWSCQELWFVPFRSLLVYPKPVPVYMAKHC